MSAAKGKAKAKGVNRIYAYTLSEHKDRAWKKPRDGGCGLIKIGQTRGDADKRIRGQLTHSPDKDYAKLLDQVAVRKDGSEFSDHDVHDALVKAGVQRVKARGEWFEVTEAELNRVVDAVRLGKHVSLAHDCYEMRPEQRQAVGQTLARWSSLPDGSPPKRFLWNAKMRFGKCFSALQLALSMKAQRILILTYMPSVETSWQDEMQGHVDFMHMRYAGKNEAIPDDDAPCVVFRSYYGLQADGDAAKARRKELALHDWDLLIVDEQHYGSDKEPAAATLSGIGLKACHRLELSGTPYGSLERRDFEADDVFTWSYPDEQMAKRKWDEDGRPGENPYRHFPRMEINAFHMNHGASMLPETIRWSLREMFKTGADGAFAHQEAVAHWLDVIQGHAPGASAGQTDAPLYPYQSSGALADECRHTVWVMGGVAECKAMERQLGRLDSGVLAHTKVVNVSGEDQDGDKALSMVRDAIASHPRTITFTVNRLLTGVTVKQWSAILMLYHGSSAIKYLQAAFRVQSPWASEGGETLKPICRVFEFDPNRAIQAVADQAEATAKAEGGGRHNAACDLLDALDVYVWHEDSSPCQIGAVELLRLASEGVGSNYMAKRWSGGSFTNANALIGHLADPEIQGIVDKIKVPTSGKAAKRLKVVISRNEAIVSGGRKVSADQLAEAKEAEKDAEDERAKNLKEQLNRVLLAVPMFMYVTPEREFSLQDVLASEARELFMALSSGIDQDEFKRLLDLGSWDAQDLDKAVVQFWNDEKGSLSYMEEFAAELAERTRQEEGERKRLAEFTGAHSDA